MISFQIKEKKIVGRYATATKALTAGSVVFEEAPFVIGPNPDSTAICLECYAPVDGTIYGTRCNKCGWPMCDECKLNSSRKNHSKECELFVQNKVKFHNLSTPHQICLQLDCITPLRICLEKEVNAERWKNEISKMEFHSEIRKNSKIWNADKINVVGYLQGPLKLKDRFSEDLIQQACGILEVNAFEARTAKGHKVRGIYPNAAVLAHSCVPNTTHSILPSKDYKLVMRTSINVKEGEELLTTYTHILSGTRERQNNLKKGKFFICKCERCTDASELGTNFSSLLCKKCEDGVILPTNPLDETAEYKCQKCSFMTPGSAVQSLIKTIDGEIAQLQEIETTIENIKLCENVFTKYSKILHSNHFLLISLKENLIDMYGWHLSNQIDNDAVVFECLDRKIALCREVLNVVSILQPGLNRARAMLIYEIYTSIGAIIKKNSASVANRGQHIMEAKKLLSECLTIFEWEDENSLEFYLARICRKISNELQSMEEFNM
ncbi:SET domain-containing protein SmydA-8-like isoform X2 [Contarinia nasturtii]|uniref:SET domain-containing protein SmydA-8-like isoform X2 n=1 Tax=Contarinia nasturtii TaxID=265458 RepID=UPI0012D3D335|nr:SET domain-containing protein SmydA-8-like isoform X2 [Contarinia nasturtii]